MRGKIKLTRKTIPMDFQINVNIHQLADNIVNQLHGNGNLEYFVALLDRLAADWEVTDTLIQHFEALKIKRLDEFSDTGEFDLKPKEIEVLL